MSNLSAIGFSSPTKESFQEMLNRALEGAVEPVELGQWAERHAWYIDPSGAAIAVHLEENQINCITPFFMPSDGGTKWRVGTSAAHLDKQCPDCSGADCDVLDPTTADLVTRSAVQWVFFDAYSEWLSESHEYDLQVAGFASMFRLCATDDEWESTQAELFGGSREPGTPIKPGEPMRVADESYLPYGMFENEGDLGSRARALVAGHIEKLVHPTNTLTGERFTWARIRTICGKLDIVSPFVASTQASPGMRLLADVWLVGRPIEPPPKKRGAGLWLVGGSGGD